MRTRATRDAVARRVDWEGEPMLRRWLRNPLLWSPIAALVAQHVLAGVVAAVTGGGDFPARR
ncbi:MAG: hypothetical protein H0U86_17205 [Chloroflexi bacterium]|nr:hypothetical protein [Chloroflexota bacterium]